MSEKIFDAVASVAETFERMYFVEELGKFASRLYRRVGENPIASNPGVQLLQSAWKTKGKAAPIAQPRNKLSGLWAELIGDRRSVMTDEQREKVILDVLVSRCLTPNVSLMGMATLSSLPAAVSKAACAERVGAEAGPHLYAFAKAGAAFLEASTVMAEATKGRKHSNISEITAAELLGITPEAEGQSKE